MILAVIGSLLPEGLQFLSPGWWVVHGVAVALVYVYGYRRGRNAERRERRRAEAAGAATRAPDRTA